jgi:hypothetical protein
MSPASAGGLPRLPISIVEVPLEDGTSGGEGASGGETAPRAQPNRARPAPESGLDQPHGLDPALAPSGAIVSPAPGPFQSFPGIIQQQQSPLLGAGKLPPDTTGDIGPNHYVQAVNTSYAVYDRAGDLLAGPIPFADTGTLAGPHGHPLAIPTPGLFNGAVFDPVDAGDPNDLRCDDHNSGDPVVLYDEQADRWVIGQFAFTSSSTPPYKQCVAVSTTPSPLGPWHLYEFELSNSATMFPDYPKIGVWNDAYYLSANGFDLTQSPADAVGGFAVALERDVMLAGGANPRMVSVQPGDLHADRLFGLLPADYDGPPPPPGTPGIFLVLEDTSYGAPADGLRLWNAAVDFDASSLTLTEGAFMQVAEFDSALCGGSRNCIPQPNPVVFGADPDPLLGLDPLSGQLLHRLAYRNFGTHQSLVTAHVADASGTNANHAGMRWYELRNSGAGWSVVQDSTFAPDANHRWMGSIAMDGAGNIGVGYTTSGPLLYPSLNFAGRYSGDTPGVLTQGEGTLATGGGSQQSTSNRWGDYSTMSVDPTDGCTFWFTSAYYPATFMSLWHTQIGTFSLLTDPTLTVVDHTPGTWSSDSTVDVSLTGAAAGCSVAGYSTAWSTDPAVPADGVADLGSETTSMRSPTLAEGLNHYVRVRTVDAKGNAGEGSVAGPFKIDLTSPTKLLIDRDTLTPFQRARRFLVAWSGSDALSGVKEYDVRYRRAPATGGFGAQKPFRSNATRTKGSLRGRAGSTYCFSVRADDAAGNGSGYGAHRCTAVPLDDRQLLGKLGWQRGTQSGAYRRTVLRTTSFGASLFAKGIRARSLALLATRCGRCGSVEVRHRGRLVGVVDLSQKPFGKGLVNELPSTKRIRKGRVTLTVVSSDRRVVIDGLAVSRTRADK